MRTALEKAHDVVELWSKDFRVRLSDFALEELVRRIAVIAKGDEKK